MKRAIKHITPSLACAIAIIVAFCAITFAVAALNISKATRILFIRKCYNIVQM